MPKVQKDWEHDENVTVETDTLIRSTGWDVRVLREIRGWALYLIEFEGEWGFLPAPLSQKIPYEQAEEIRDKLADSVVWGGYDELLEALVTWGVTNKQQHVVDDFRVELNRVPEVK